MKKLIPVLALVLLPSFSFAKTADQYRVSVEVKNTHLDRLGFGSKAPESVLFLMGITCTSSLKVREIESFLDKRGNQKETGSTVGRDFSLTFLGQPQSTTDLWVNPESPGARIALELSEFCSGDVRKSFCRTSEDDDCMDHLRLPMHWSCSVSAADLPSDGQSKQISCNPPNNNSFLDFLLNGAADTWVMNYAHAKEITATIEKKKTDYQFENYNCREDLDLAHLDPSAVKIVRLEGGVEVGGFSGDIQYDYSINDGPKMRKIQKDGSANFDILYCLSRPNEPIDLKIVATHGKNVSPVNEASLKGDSGESRILKFSMPASLFGHLESQIRVKIAN